MGNYAGYKNSTGDSLVIIGTKAGYNNTSGTSNIFIGDHSGYRTTTGSRNSFMGWNAGYNNTTGYDNIYLGTKSGYSNTSGIYNVSIGAGAGNSNIDGSNNINIGLYAGYANQHGTNNICIGPNTGRGNYSSYRLYIGHGPWNSTTKDYGPPILYGEMDNYLLRICSDLQINAVNPFLDAMTDRICKIYSTSFYDGILDIYKDDNATIRLRGNGSSYFIGGDVGFGTTSPSAKIDVVANLQGGYAAEFFNDGNDLGRYGISIKAGADGTAEGSGVSYFIKFYDGNGGFCGHIGCTNGSMFYTGVSDKRLKKNIVISKINALNILKDLRVVDYMFKEGTQIHTGYIAQEAQKIFPEMVIYDEELDTYTTTMNKLIPVLHKAINEQQQIIEAQSKELDEMKQQIRELKQMVGVAGK